MTSRLSALFLVVWISAIGAHVPASGHSPQPSVRFDVNDVSYLWPVPSNSSDVAQLLSGDTPVSGGGPSILPGAVLKKLLDTARDVRVDRGLGQSQIQFGQFDKVFNDPRTWKVVGFRVDPTAPGGHAGLRKVLGSTPQLRVILQPVTQEGNSVQVHDVTAHLAFSFFKGTPTSMPRVPDKDLFGAIVNDLKALKADAEAGGVKTEGPLKVHPALKQPVSGFNDRVKAFLTRHMTEDKLTELAFMGLDSPEPWIFFIMRRNGLTFDLIKPGALGGTVDAQMLIFRGGSPVLPAPRTTNVTAKTGVSTAQLFDSPASLDAPAISGSGQPRLRDIPDVIANPEKSNVLNTDCVSCHSESTLRARLKIAPDGPLGYRRPTGISGVDPGHLPTTKWNVRNFGWFPDIFQGGKTVATISMRTANESAEAADFVNREYLAASGGGGAVPAGGSGEAGTPVGTSGQGPSQPTTRPQPVASPLTLVMTIKSKADHDQLKAEIEQLQSLPPEKNPIVIALNQIGTVHFARFVFLSERQLAVITTYDGSFDLYIDAFVNSIGKIFDKILSHVEDAPPLPVSEHRKEFLAYVKKNDLTGMPPFYSAYPNLRVLDIIELQQKAKGGK
jgi:hypothetical protein